MSARGRCRTLVWMSGNGGKRTSVHQVSTAAGCNPVRPLSRTASTNLSDTKVAPPADRLSTHRCARRIAHLLCEMATRLQAVRTDGGTMFPWAITQTQLADATGLTPVHVNRSLKSLRETGLAEVSSRAVRISSFDALANFGDFDAGYLQTDVRPEQRMRLAEVV